MARKNPVSLPSLPSPDFEVEPAPVDASTATVPPAEFYTVSQLVDPDTSEATADIDGPFPSKREAGKHLADEGREGLILRRVGSVVFEVLRKARIA